MLNLHFLVMTSALLGFPCFHKFFHSFEYFVRSSQVFVEEMAAVQLQKPMIFFAL